MVRHEGVKDEETGVQVRFNKHPKRRNNYVVAGMYQMYLTGNDGQGCSLSEIAKVYKVTRQAVYDVFRSRGFELRSKRLKGLTVIDGISFTLMRDGGYLRGTVPGRGRMLAHYYVWQRDRGVIPEGYVIHLKDGNPANVVIENLELIKKKDMASRFNPMGNNQYTKGRTLKTVVK